MALLTGWGREMHSSKLVNSPWYVAFSSLQRARMAAMLSSVRAPRSAKGTPMASNSSSSQPTPGELFRTNVRGPSGLFVIIVVSFGGLAFQADHCPSPGTVIELPFGFEAPESILVDMIHNLPDSQGYSDSRGIFSARTAVANFYQNEGLRDVTTDLHIKNPQLVVEVDREKLSRMLETFEKIEAEFTDTAINESGDGGRWEVICHADLPVEFLRCPCAANRVASSVPNIAFVNLPQ